MSKVDPLTLIGVAASPYTRKMIALLRYRRIPYRIIWGNPVDILQEMEIAPPKVGLLPTFLLPDELGNIQAVCDSTPITRRLDKDYSDREVIPSNPALAFVDYLLEDFADEWCTKFMFHYRWYPDLGADNAGTLLPLLHSVDLPDTSVSQFKSYITDRQRGRLHVVGSNEITAPLIDTSYRRFLDAFNSHLTHQPFVLGHRPSSCDFAFYGQLTQLIGFDPTSRQIAHDLAPRVVAWTTLMEDLCGLELNEVSWCELGVSPETLKNLFKEVGKFYVPALLTNARALREKKSTWEAEINDGLWSQETFAYQGKCLGWIRDEYEKLSDQDRLEVDLILDGTGCQELLI
jgi:glutathione S-transferase